jgi:hypothetical protein
MHNFVYDQLPDPKQNNGTKGFKEAGQGIDQKKPGGCPVDFRKKTGDRTPSFKGVLQIDPILICYGFESGTPHIPAS